MEKTIAAISTGHVAAGIAIVRLSGPEAITIADRVFRGKEKLKKAATHRLCYGHIRNGEELLDEVLVSVMRGPHSFTGEDVVEINSHGGTFVAKKILALLVEKGAALAEPGEFTKRAFLNGRLDLTEAEGVLEVIEAKNEFALKAANKALRGDIGLKIRELRAVLLDECAFIEAALDDPEHYDLTGYEAALAEKIGPVEAEIERLLSHADYGEMMKEGIQTVICGRPNAGKSSLLNLLAKSDKAIVTDVEGTTRDILEVNVRLGDFMLVLKDTAGLRETTDAVEKIGVTKAKEAMESADLVLYMATADGLTEEDEENLKALSSVPTILLLNKADLRKPDIPEKAIPTIPFSCVSGEGLAELEETIAKLFEDGTVRENDELYITNERQKNLLAEAKKSLGEVRRSIEKGLSEDFLTIDLVNAYTYLGQIIGESVTDDVIDRVFEKFCMGK